MYMWGAGAGGRAAQAAGPVRARRTIHIYANLTPWGDRGRATTNGFTDNRVSEGVPEHWVGGLTLNT